VNEKPAFIQGMYSRKGDGLACPVPFDPPVTYTVPADKRAQTIYFRAGNASVELIYLILTRDGVPMRYFPIGAKAAIHVPLAVVEDLEPGSRVEVLLAAANTGETSVVLDIGFLEIA
jgi:hypothetical protein